MRAAASASWTPSAAPSTLKKRAQLYSCVRNFFAARDVLEVETPLLSHHATVDRHLDSFAVHSAQGAPAGWLHTSPEFAMKRLLAAGSGSIWQICKVFRVDEQGRYHNPEFSMLEWYRLGFDHHALMDEVAALLQACGVSAACARVSYRQAFLHHAGFDPLVLTAAQIRQRFIAHGLNEPMGLTQADIENRDFWLDLWMSDVVSPRLGLIQPQFVYDFPASQAALARVRADDPPVAERFELFWKGIELANGFHELTDAAEQQQRFEADQCARRSAGLVVPPYDKNLIAALNAGLPACAGVAVGLDRLLMLAEGLPSLDQTLAFAFDRA